MQYFHGLQAKPSNGIETVSLRLRRNCEHFASQSMLFNSSKSKIWKQFAYDLGCQNPVSHSKSPSAITRIRIAGIERVVFKRSRCHQHDMSTTDSPIIVRSFQKDLPHIDFFTLLLRIVLFAAFGIFGPSTRGSILTISSITNFLFKVLMSSGRFQSSFLIRISS